MDNTVNLLRKIITIFLGAAIVASLFGGWSGRIYASELISRVKVTYLPNQFWDLTKDPYFRKNEIIVPEKPVKGTDVPPAACPNGFYRVFYNRVLAYDYNKLFEAYGERMERDEYFLSYFGEGNGFKVFSEIYSQLYDSGYALKDSTFDKYKGFESENTPCDGYTIEFASDNIQGTATVFSFIDLKARRFTLIKYHFTVRGGAS